jgi:hypothetical protein
MPIASRSALYVLPDPEEPASSTFNQICSLSAFWNAKLICPFFLFFIFNENGFRCD